MKLIESKNNENLVEEYIELFRELYKDDFRLDSQIKTIKKSFSKNNPFYKNGTTKNFLVMKNNKPIGHCTAIIDKRIINKGFIGFYDCVKDEEVNTFLLRSAVNWLKQNKCKTICGPINLTIWHNYRFIQEIMKTPEIFDPFSKEYYNIFWEKFGFIKSEKYVSAKRTNFDYVITPSNKAMESFKKNKFIIRNFNKKNPTNDLRIIMNLSNEIFLKSWNFVKIDFSEFFYLYKDLLPIIQKENINIVENQKKEPVGFCFNLPNPYNKSQIILKTIGVLKEYRRLGVASALLNYCHKNAKKLGFKEYYYPLIRVGNNVTKFPYEGYEIITKYSTYELK